MKKQNSFLIAFLAAAALLVVTTGVVFASSLMHDNPPFNPEGEGYPGSFDADDEHWGPMHGRSSQYRPFGLGDSFMMSEMVDAVSAQTDLTVEEIESRLAEGERLYTIALDAGLDETTFFDLMAEVRTEYFNDAVENGWMTEEQYQWRIDRMDDPSARNGDGFPCHQQTDENLPMFNGIPRGHGRRW